MGTYQPAAICSNGHTATQNAHNHAPGQFCGECGDKIIQGCPSCNAIIRGYYDVPGVISLGRNYEPASYCFQCGVPYPWTQRKMQAIADTLTATDELTDFEVESLRTSLPNIVRDVPQTKPAALKIAALITRVKEPVQRVARDLLMDVASEAAKKVMFG